MATEAGLDDLDRSRTMSASSSSIDLSRPVLSSRSAASDEQASQINCGSNLLHKIIVCQSLYALCVCIQRVLLMYSVHDIRKLCGQGIRTIALTLFSCDNATVSYSIETETNGTDISIAPKSATTQATGCIVAFRSLPVVALDLLHNHAHVCGDISHESPNYEMDDDTTIKMCNRLENHLNVPALLTKLKIGSGLSTRYKWVRVKDVLRDAASTMQKKQLDAPSDIGYIVAAVGIVVISFGPFSATSNIGDVRVSVVNPPP